LLLGCGQHWRSKRPEQKMTAIQWHSTQYTRARGLSAKIDKKGGVAQSVRATVS
jgi:hypothetical protein